MAPTYREPVHPVTGEALTELQRFLWRFRMVANEAHVMLRGFHRTGDAAKVLNDDLLFALSNQALVIVCKFLEIWDGFGALEKESDSVMNVRRAVKPYIDRIRVWKGLEAFRNTALAHPYLTKKGRLIGPWTLISEEKAPVFHAECFLLLYCVHFAVLGILTAFESEYNSLKPILVSDKPHPTPGPGIGLGTEIDPDLKKLAAAVDEKLKAIGLIVTGALAVEFIVASGNSWPPKKA